MIEQLELTPQNTIRLETAFSRFPVHKLARRGNINIEIMETTPTGEIKTKWGVDYPKKAGQPRPLAYKVDTLVVNRRIDDERPSIPKVIKLGSLSEICRELGMRVSGGNSNELKKAIHQNASAYITAKINYKTANGAENVIEAGFSRYSVIFTGEKLPDGRKVNAVYLILNDVYLKVLNEVQTRPLDYNYLRDLPPAAQRFYEFLRIKWLGSLLFGAFVVSLALTAHLFENLANSPNRGLFIQLVQWRMILYFGPGVKCLLWYYRSINELKRECLGVTTAEAKQIDIRR